MNKWITYAACLLGWITGGFVVTKFGAGIDDALSSIFTATIFGALVTFRIKTKH